VNFDDDEVEALRQTLHHVRREGLKPETHWWGC
jgi:hypothetical protein